jgi:hypothetical protein
VPPAPDLPWSSWAGGLPVAVAQRLACDCEVWRVVLDPATGLPLEVGRAHRIVPTWMRKRCTPAIAAADGPAARCPPPGRRWSCSYSTDTVTVVLVTTERCLNA